MDAYVTVRYGMLQHGRAWYGMIYQVYLYVNSTVWYGMDLVWYDIICLTSYGMMWHGMVRNDVWFDITL